MKNLKKLISGLALVSVFIGCSISPEQYVKNYSDYITSSPVPTNSIPANNGSGSNIIVDNENYSGGGNEDKAWIPVPFQSQLDTGKNKGNYCCGLAAVNMGTAYLYGKNPTAEYLTKMYQYLNLDNGCKAIGETEGGTSQDQQLNVAKEVGNAKNSYNKLMTFEEAKTILKNGHPIVVGLNYAPIKDKCSNYNKFHSVILIGYNGVGGYWVVNDPLCSSASSGLNKKIPSSEFREATEIWSKTNKGSNSGYLYGTVLIK